jgi:hypothetical protein
MMTLITKVRGWHDDVAIDFCASTGWPAAWEEIISTSGDGNSSLLLSSRVINSSHIRYEQERRHGTSRSSGVPGSSGVKTGFKSGNKSEQINGTRSHVAEEFHLLVPSTTITEYKTVHPSF